MSENKADPLREALAAFTNFIDEPQQYEHLRMVRIQTARVATQPAAPLGGRDALGLLIMRGLGVFSDIDARWANGDAWKDPCLNAADAILAAGPQVPDVPTPIARLALEIAGRYEAGAERCAASGYEEFGEAFQAERKIIVSALRRYAAVPDRAAYEECALRLDESAAYEDRHIEAIKQDHGLSETGRESLIEHAVTRRTAFRQGASSIRHLRALAGKETGR